MGSEAACIVRCVGHRCILSIIVAKIASKCQLTNPAFASNEFIYTQETSNMRLGISGSEFSITASNRDNREIMKFFINGKWSAGSSATEVTNPYDQSVINTVPVPGESDIETTIAGAVTGSEIMRKLTGYERSVMLQKAAELVNQRKDELAHTISLEAGKTIRESTGEVSRAAATLELSAEEAKRISGEVLPLDGASLTKGKFGFTMRIPCGVVLAITPFNFPLNLVCHKIGPALAAGNAAIIKPAEETPLSALKLVEILLEAGCPPLAISCLTGDGPNVGAALCKDSGIRKISFTGSRNVGEQICKMAGLKRVTMELGSNSPLVVLPDADLKKVTDMIAIAGYSNAGQVCISAQRIIVHQQVFEEMSDRLQERIPRIKTGNQIEQETQVGPMIRLKDAERVEAWIREAVEQGAQLVCGGGRNHTLCEPTVLKNVTPEMKVVSEELFGPAVGLMKAENVEDAIRQVNQSPYGLSAAVYTQDIDHALQFANQVDSGNIHINGGPMWRSDLMPYGGIKDSGMGKEGPKYAIEEMTELKTVVIHAKT